MSSTTKNIEYEYILKEAMYKKRQPVDRWFLNYCMKYAALCERVKGGGAAA